MIKGSDQGGRVIDQLLPGFMERLIIRGKDAVTLARDPLALHDEGFRAAFRKSPMKRAKLAGLQRNPMVVLASDQER